MKVTNLVEHEDGSADMMVELDEWEHKAVMQEGFISLLTRYAEEEKEKRKVPALERKKDSEDK